MATKGLFKRGNSAKNNTVISDTNATEVDISYCNQKFGRLTIIGLSGFNKYKTKVYACNCICGNIAYRTISSLKKGNKNTSCGCFNKQILKQSLQKISNNVDINLSGSKEVRKKYRQSAKKRDLNFELTLEEVTQLIKGYCVYCNSEPSNKMKVASRYFIYNGIDRVNTKIGYVFNNCVTCCFTCNIMKFDLTLNEFKNHIEKVYKCLNF